MRSNPLLALSYELSDLPTRDAYLRAAGVCLSNLLPGEDTFWLETDFGGRSAHVWHGPDWTADPALGGLLLQADDHPAILSYLDDPGDLSPRRLSVVRATRAWRNSHAHDLLSGPMGCHQLSLIVRLTPPTRGNGWTIGRTDTDFTEAERDLAGSLLPLLTILDRLYERCPPEPSSTVLQARERSKLTAREVDILTLVAEGLTAVAIGHLRRLSSATVRKHLEHVYDKLDCHDRLMAVQKARSLGLLPAPRQPSATAAHT